ncbi:retropepsin-like aspartic protease family protein [Leptothrix discophora]|uniref:Retropepsin-like aspartic protease n=1 Tax=Leptothrix discophora TaxID=89 RepID=A0ABT9G889_LEPDI|nr:retropepsin-like aspartic protease [Leptothrix discophora]MDP4302636.1 retropepsin-like aspartic protease [Leptothrix discophora]
MARPAGFLSTPARRPALIGAALVALLSSWPASAQNVSYAGRMGDRALLVIDGAPRTLGLGQEAQGVKLLMLDGENATVMIRDQRLSLRMGAQPASIGAAPAAAGPTASGATARDSGQRIVLGAGSDGHFQVNGSIGGKPVRFLVDTGASAVSMSQQEADRLGLNWRAGKRVSMQTANGIAPAWRLSVDRVRIGEVELHQVDTVVGPQDMPVVLLGNSFLSRFRMQRDGEQMVLERRY